jgi:hypothetical protein
MQAFSGHTHPDAIACCLVHVSAQAGLQGVVFGCLFIQVPTLFFCLRCSLTRPRQLVAWFFILYCALFLAAESA